MKAKAPRSNKKLKFDKKRGGVTKDDKNSKNRNDKEKIKRKRNFVRKIFKKKKKVDRPS